MDAIRRRFAALADHPDVEEMISRGHAWRAPNGVVLPVLAGGADDVDHVEEIVTRVTAEDGMAEITDDELGEYEQGLVDEIARLGEGEDGAPPSDDDLARMEALAAHVEALRTEAANREQAAEDRATRRDEVLNRVNGEDDDADGEGDGSTEGEGTEGEGSEGSDDNAEGTEGEGSEGEGTGDGDGSTTDDADGSGEGTDGEGTQPQAQAASGAGRGTGARRGAAARRPSLNRLSRRTPAGRAPRPTNDNAPALVAAGGIPDVEAGAPVADMEEAARLFTQRHNAFRGPANSYEQIPVLRLRTDYPEERRLGDNDEANSAIVAAAIREAMNTPADVLVAAGGLCAPVAISYDLLNVSVADRPVRDSLPQFNPTRGGIRFPIPPSFAAFEEAVDVWDMDRDTDAASNADVKPCLRVECDDFEEVLTAAITRCLEFGNIGARAWPEQVADALAKTMAWQARLAETRLLQEMGDKSTDVTVGQGLGAARQILSVLALSATAYRDRHRMADATALRVILPRWVRAMIREDLAAEAPGSSAERLATAEATITTFFAVRDINVTWAIEGASAGQQFGAQGDGAQLPWPEEVVALLFHEGAHLFLDNGELDLGIVRDSGLNEKNDYRIFGETFENVAFVGMESQRIFIPVCPTGATSESVAYDGACAGS